MKTIKFESLVGTTFTNIQKYEGSLWLADTSGLIYWMGHEDSCCEYVELTDIEGDLEDLLYFPIMLAEEVTHPHDTDKHREWVFYKLATIRGYVTLRWCRDNDSCYSTAVDFKELMGGTYSFYADREYKLACKILARR